MAVVTVNDSTKRGTLPVATINQSERRRNRAKNSEDGRCYDGKDGRPSERTVSPLAAAWQPARPDVARRLPARPRLPAAAAPTRPDAARRRRGLAVREHAAEVARGRPRRAVAARAYGL